MNLCSFKGEIYLFSFRQCFEKNRVSRLDIESNSGNVLLFVLIHRFKVSYKAIINIRIHSFSLIINKITNKLFSSSLLHQHLYKIYHN